MAGESETGDSDAIESTYQKIVKIKEILGSSLVILGHHYQTDSVLKHADFRGDSLKLARDASNCREARYIVFCGVRFMAETAAILAQPGQMVFLPALDAGCSMADMAALEDVERVWAELGKVLDVEHEVLPITYINSSASLKAFCGEHGGLVCTSSNAESVLTWALERHRRVLFFPDQHLGRNTAKRIGIPLERMTLWDQTLPNGGNDVQVLQKAQIVLWNGFCNVHQCFRPEHISYWRKREPDIRIIVHPECMMDVVDLADEAGSTEAIIHCIEASPAGSKWAIGTEGNLVHRLVTEHPDQYIVSLSPEPSYCSTMGCVTVGNLAYILERLVSGQFVNQITVPDTVARPARLALERMLSIQ